MQLIYVHGLNSDERSLKGQWLQDYCAQHFTDITVKRPNLNLPPLEVMQLLGDLIKQQPDTVLVGSSLGGFYATACVARHNIKAVLLNPSVRPFESFAKRYFSHGEHDFITETGWRITPAQLGDLRALYDPQPQHSDKLLVLLQQGDEVLDYRVAQAHYSQPGAQCRIIVEQGGDHFMHNLPDKLPLILDFLRR